MINFNCFVKCILLYLLLLIISSCSSAYSTWSTLGYSSGNVGVSSVVRNGVYGPPLLKLTNEIYAWFTPGRVHQVKEGGQCDGFYEEFTFNIWLIENDASLDIESSYFKINSDNEIHISYLKGFNTYSYKDDENVLLKATLLPNDREVLQGFVKSKAFTPTISFAKKANALLVSLDKKVPCNLELLTLYIFINGESHKIDFKPVVYKKLNR